MSKHIVIVCHHYPPHISGVGLIAESQAKRLAEAGNKVTIVTSSTNSNEKSRFDTNVEIVCVKASNIMEEKWGAPFPFFSPRILDVLWRTIKAADIVHIHDAFYISSFVAAFFARLQGKPVVMTQHVEMIAHPSSVVMLAQKIVYATTGAFIFNASKKIMVYNGRVRQFLLDKKIPSEKIVLLLNGVDMKVFRPADMAEKQELKKEFGVHSDKRTALFIGRFVPKKGFEKLIAAGDPSYQIVFAGGDTKLKSDDSLLFLGKLPQATVARLYRAADLFILPSEGEGFPLSIQEAMSCGLPIITSDDPGYDLYKINRDHVAFLDKPTAESIRNELKSIFDNENKLRNMSAYSRKYAADRFDWTVIMEQLNEIYAGVLPALKK